MNALRQAEETIPSRSAVGLSERLATPLAEPTRTGRFRRHLRRIDAVATPAVVGTTAAWATMTFLRWMIGAPDIGWFPTTRVLIIAYAATIALSMFLAYGAKRLHWAHAAFATFFGVTFAIARTYGEYQSWEWTSLAVRDGMRELALRNVGAMALAVLSMGVFWLPAVILTYFGRKTLAERVREMEPHG